MWLSTSVVFLRFIVGIMFLLAGFLKLRAGTDWFRQSIRDYALVKGRLLDVLTYSVPALEVICGLLLITGIVLPFASVLSFFLLVVFTCAILSALIQRREINCGCFGQKLRSVQLHRTFLYRNTTLLAFVVIIYAHSTGIAANVLDFGFFASMDSIREIGLSAAILTTAIFIIIIVVIEFNTRIRRRT